MYVLSRRSEVSGLYYKQTWGSYRSWEKEKRDYPIHNNVREVHAFTGFVGCYRKYVKAFCKIREPLTNLTRNNAPFVWDEKYQKAFEVLKQKLINPPVLAYPRFKGTKFILQADASSQGVGFLLAQIYDGNKKSHHMAVQLLNHQKETILSLNLKHSQ